MWVRPTKEDVHKMATDDAVAATAPVVERLERVEARPGVGRTLRRVRPWPASGALAGKSLAALLLERGKHVLSAAGVDMADVKAIAPVTARAGTGSSVQVAFISVAALERARVQVRAAAVVLEGQSREAWVDHQRSMQESRLVRAVHRLAEYLGDVHGSRLRRTWRRERSVSAHGAWLSSAPKASLGRCMARNRGRPPSARRLRLSPWACDGGTAASRASRSMQGGVAAAQWASRRSRRRWTARRCVGSWPSSQSWTAALQMRPRLFGAKAVCIATTLGQVASP